MHVRDVKAFVQSTCIFCSHTSLKQTHAQYAQGCSDQVEVLRLLLRNADELDVDDFATARNNAHPTRPGGFFRAIAVELAKLIRSLHKMLNLAN